VSDKQRCGYIGLVGRPNVGKSTLLNRIVGQDLSITAPKPQTTRHRILGIHTRGDVQMLFVDTPGLHEARRNALNRVLNRTALAVAEEVDCLVLVVQMPRVTDADRTLLARLHTDGRTLVIALNKIDRVAKTELLPALQELGTLAPDAQIVPVSARSGENVERLEELLAAHLPERAFVYPADQLSDRSQRFFVAEIVREQLTRQLEQELPYELSVETEQFIEHDTSVEVSVLIWVGRDSQKGIVVGRNGETLKKVGTLARRRMADLLGKRVHLSTWVKVKQGWVDDERALHRLGYDS
jgi:GTP-binding protein Era